MCVVPRRKWAGGILNSRVPVANVKITLRPGRVMHTRKIIVTSLHRDRKFQVPKSCVTLSGQALCRELNSVPNRVQKSGSSEHQCDGRTSDTVPRTSWDIVIGRSERRCGPGEWVN